MYDVSTGREEVEIYMYYVAKHQLRFFILLLNLQVKIDTSVYRLLGDSGQFPVHDRDNIMDAGFWKINCRYLIAMCI